LRPETKTVVCGPTDPLANWNPQQLQDLHSFSQASGEIQLADLVSMQVSGWICLDLCAPVYSQLLAVYLLSIVGLQHTAEVLICLPV